MKNKRKIWDDIWSYKEGLIIAITLFFIGSFLQFFSHNQGIASFFNYPLNFYFFSGLIVVILVLWLTLKNLPLTQWLGSIPGAISSIAFFLFIGLLMGLNLQNGTTDGGFFQKIGFNNITNSWPYLFSILWLQLSLGITTLKNLNPLNKKKIGFTISHLGLFIVISGSNFGSTQVERLEMKLTENKINNVAINSKTKKIVELPFAIKLNDFILKEYLPKLTFVNNVNGNVEHGNGKNLLICDTNSIYNALGYKIKIKKFIETAAKAGNKYYFINEPGAAPAALVEITSPTGKLINGWISCGSYNRQYESLKIDSSYSMVMFFPEAKDFISKISILTPTGEETSAKLRVNYPFEYFDYRIYQLSYDSNLGRWSDSSTIELIKDPWLPSVYFGIFLMLIGAVYMFWTGAGKKTLKNGLD